MYLTMFNSAKNERVLSSNQITYIIVRVVPMVIIAQNDCRKDILAVRIICNNNDNFCLLHKLVLGKQSREGEFYVA